ncbi:sulfatase-like hydrolase/transferase [bacterium]|nr:sulfatase-like hydrolase/transferase [bacterium]
MFFGGFNRRHFIKSLGALPLGLGSRALGKAESKRPNILFIFSDDHSLQTLGAYRARMQAFIKQHNITPNIDRIAAQGVIFDHSFVGNSICGPSRASILTGKHSHINGFKANGDRFDGSQWTVAKELQKHNYQTAVIGKWHLGTRPTGFDEYQILPGQGTYYNPDFITKGADQPVRQQGYCSDIIGDLTLEWLDKKRDKSKPFFLCSWHKAPHRTWLPHPRHFHLLDGMEVPEPENLFDDYEGRTSSAREQEMTIRDHINIATDVKVTPPVATTPAETIREAAPKTQSQDMATIREFKRMTPAQKKAWDEYYVPRNETFREQNPQGDELVRWKYQAYLKDYIKCIKAMDENVGRVLDYLKENGLEENTIVIYSSDQGFYNGEHGWYDKRWMYEESLRNPLIVKWPHVTQPGTRRQELVQNIDYAPTILEAAGITPPRDVQGESLVPLLKGEAPEDWRKSILYTYYGRGAHNVKSHRGVRNDRYKLIEFHTKGEWEFYDLKKDPLEMKSEYDNPKYAQIIRGMKKELKKLMTEYRLE